MTQNVLPGKSELLKRPGMGKLSLGGKRLSEAKEVEYLGITMDSGGMLNAELITRISNSKSRLQQLAASCCRAQSYWLLSR